MSEQNNLETKLAKLNQMLEWFDGEDFQVEQAVTRFKAAESLVAEIETDLDNLKNEVVVLKQKFDQAE